MELITGMFDFIMNIDTHLTELTKMFGIWTYFILFLVVFCETGLVVTPFLPGDSLLFVLGALRTQGTLDFSVTIVVLIAAAVLGNILNYFFGRMIGEKIMKKEKSIFIKKTHLEKANSFYERHGARIIIISRFLPILRTFAPFVAGIGKMNFLKFFVYNLIGGSAWVLVCMLSGLFFGNIPVVKENFSYDIIVIFVFSLFPALITYIKTRRGKRE